MTLHHGWLPPAVAAWSSSGSPRPSHLPMALRYSSGASGSRSRNGMCGGFRRVPDGSDLASLESIATPRKGHGLHAPPSQSSSTAYVELNNKCQILSVQMGTAALATRGAQGHFR